MNKNVLYFEREIENIEDQIQQTSLIGKFIDLDKNKKVDINGKELLNKLKNEKIEKSNLSENNKFKFKVNQFFFGSCKIFINIY